MILGGRAALVGVMGWPGSHSLSPRPHGFRLEQYGIDSAYLPFAVAPEHFESSLRRFANRTAARAFALAD